VSSSSFVTFLQNHDQVANSAHGLRGDRLTSPGRWRAMTALLLLGPGTPMLFQGQEFSSSAPFLYFADFDPELNAAVREGRKQFLSQFSSVVDATRQGVLDDPSAMETFERCRLDFGDRKANAGIYALHQELLRLRRSTAAFRDRGGVDGAVLSSQAFALRFFTPNHSDDRVLVVNLGAGLRRTSIAEPLLAPPANCEWIVDWCSEDANYGGPGTPEIVSPDGHWMFPGESAVVFAPAAAAQPRRCEEFGKR
jgi:maltooligosyltrehalose trehalohydrolase